MLLENLATRRQRLEAALADFRYRRFLAQEELEAIDRQIAQIEGALNENEAARRDTETEAAINQAKAEAAAVENGGS